MPSMYPLLSVRPVVAILVAMLTIAGAQSAAAACSCTAMTVKTSGTSQAYCVNATANFDECTVVTTKSCPSGQKAVQCPLGPKSGQASSQYWMGYGFEVSSTISGTASQCNNGQGLKHEIMSGTATTSPGRISYNTPAGGTYTVTGSGTSYTAVIDSDKRKNWPNISATSSGNPLYGADNYSTSSSTDTTISSTATSLYWADLPSIYFDSTDLGKTITLTDQAFTFVLNSGSGSTKPMSGPGCACAVRYTMTKAPMASWSVANLNAAVSGSKTNVATVSCTVSP